MDIDSGPALNAICQGDSLYALELHILARVAHCNVQAQSPTYCMQLHWLSLRIGHRKKVMQHIAST